MKARNETDQAIEFIKSFIQKILSLKYVYIATIVVFLGAAYMFNKYAPRVYELSATIGPLKDTRTSALASNEMFRGGGYSASSAGRELDAAINNLSSFALILKTVSDLNLEVGYFESNRNFLKQYTEVFQQSPFTVNLDKTHNQTIGAKYYVTILSNSSYRLKVVAKDAILYNYVNNNTIADEIQLNFDTICKFNETISNDHFRFSLIPNTLFFPSTFHDDEYYFEFYHPEHLAKALQKSLGVEPVSWIASIIEVKFSSTNLQKSLSFLNSYINLFLEDNLEKKNKIARNTISFIDSQIAGMSDSLVKSESSLRDFRSSNQVMDLSYQGQQIYSQMAQIESERTNLELQSRYYNYILNYFKTNQDVSGVTPPTSANITDPILNKLISDLFALNAEKSAISGNTDKNLFSAQLDTKINAQIKAIVDNVTNNLNTLNLTLNELNYKAEKLSGDMSNLPKKEMNMVNIQRDFDRNNSIYTYLLQKKAESAITLSSNYPDFEVIEPAREVTSVIIRPRKLFNFVVALFLALLLPTMFIFIRDFLSDKVGTIYEVEQICDKSVFGVIYANSKKHEAVVAESPGSAIAESFRNLRSSLFLKLKATGPKVILLTSSQPQDGKSFISFNLSASIASVGFKTVLIDCDFRRPTMHDKLKIENTKGLSNYMIKKLKADDIINETSIENLHFIPSGPILSNPSELIEAGTLDDLLSYLKSSYDYIIIDTPPLGLVSDTIQLMKYASQIIVVSRLNATRKDVLSNAISILETNKIDNFEMVVNGQNLEKGPYSGYKSYYHKD